jgi:beta-lactamase regulating signal transducer with metallopeptidase domain
MSVSLHPSFAQALGWALVHSLWQGAVLGLLAWVGLRVLRTRGPQGRYLLSCALLALMLALPVATLLLLWTPVQLGPGAGLDGAEVALLLARSASLPSEPTLRPFLPWLIAAWTVGVSVMSLRLVGGWCWIQRLRWMGLEPVAAHWQARLDHLARQMGMAATVRLRSSFAAEVPMVLGWLRPLILVPVAIFTAMEPRALEAILAHELAHVRRHDYFVNLLQSVVEVLLFFHPAVWWLSAQIRAERENCCDDMAVSICGDPLLFARALAVLEDLRQPLNPHPSLALAATGGTLMNRIRRILAPKLPPSPAARAGLLAALAVSVLGAASTLGLRTQEPPKAPEAKQESREEKKVVTIVIDDDAKASRKHKFESKGKVFHWQAMDSKAEKELEARAKLLEEKARTLAERRLAKGTPEKEIVQLQEDVSKLAKEVAAQAQKLAGAHAHAGEIDAENIRVIVGQAKANAEHARQKGEEIRKEVKQHITVLRSQKDGQPVTIYTDNGDAKTIDVDVKLEGDGKHMIVKELRRKGSDGEVVILGGHDEDPQAEIEALKKIIQKMQGRLEKLQQAAAKAPKATPTK